MIDRRTLLRIDAIFELTIAGILLALVVAGVDLRDTFGLPAIIMLLLAAALIAVGLYLWVAAPTTELLRSLAIANLAGAVIFGGWVILRADEMSGAGSAIVSGIAAGLAILAAAEFAAARQSRG